MVPAEVTGARVAAGAAGAPSPNTEIRWPSKLGSGAVASAGPTVRSAMASTGSAIMPRPRPAFDGACAAGAETGGPDGVAGSSGGVHRNVGIRVIRAMRGVPVYSSDGQH